MQVNQIEMFFAGHVADRLGVFSQSPIPFFHVDTQLQRVLKRHGGHQHQAVGIGA